MANGGLMTKPTRRKTAPALARTDRHTRTVRDILRAFATRGVLRNFDERTGRGGKSEFRFNWLLDQPFRLVFDPAKSQLELKDVLPHVPSRSHLDLSVRRFVEGRADKSLPSHRRIDPGKVIVSHVNRKSHVSFQFFVKRNQYTYAVPKVLNFCNELFGYLDLNHVQYLWAHMGVPEE